MDFKKFSKLIMIEQTFFALPFAYIGVLFAGGGNLWQWTWVTLALIGARTAGMSFNRVLDAEIDAKNPRTKDRLIPRGEVSKLSVWVTAIISSILLVLSSFMLNMLCFYLSFAAVILLFTYSLFKRFSSTSHFYLGFVEAAAPIGGYLAIKGDFDTMLFIPGIAIMFWIAGIDLMYSIQDENFDRQEGLFSIAAKLGKQKTFTISMLSYILSMFSLVAIGVIAEFYHAYVVSMAIVMFIFIKQQMIARNGTRDFQKNIIEIFFWNRFVSPVIFFGMLIDIIAKKF